MATNEPSQSLFKRHRIFPLIFTFLILAIIVASTALVQQQKTVGSKAAGCTGNGQTAPGGKESNCCSKYAPFGVCSAVAEPNRINACPAGKGGTGEACCPGDQPAPNGRLCRDGNDNCQDGVCRSKSTQPSPDTAPNLGCPAGKGGTGEPCCQGSTCRNNKTESCQGGICKSKQGVGIDLGNGATIPGCPAGKGGTGEACCPENMPAVVSGNARACRSPSDNCQSGVCRSKVPGALCGGPGQTCCANNTCPDSTALFCQNGGCNSIACGPGKPCPAGKSCVNFGFNPVCARGNVPSNVDTSAPAPAYSQAAYSTGGGGTGGGGTGDGRAPTAKEPAKSCAPENTCAVDSRFNGECCAGLVKNTNTLCHVCEKPGSPAPVGNVTLNLKLKFQGIVSQPKSEFNKMKVKMSLTEFLTGSGDFVADSNGVWSGKVTINNVPLAPKYSIFVKGPKHMQKRICVPAPTETRGGLFTCQNAAITLQEGENTFDFSGILQLTGDLPLSSNGVASSGLFHFIRQVFAAEIGQQDGVVDSVDVSFIRQNLTNTDSDALAIGDVNLNGVIDSQDYSLVIAALSIKTDDAIK